MESEQKFTLTEAHAHFARTINNEVWGYIEKTERSVEDAERMVIGFLRLDLPLALRRNSTQPAAW